MAATQLDRKETCRLDCMRNIGEGETQGRYFEDAIAATTLFTNAEYEALVTWYVATEAKATAGQLRGIDVNGAQFVIQNFATTYPERPAAPNPLPHRP